MYTYPNISLMWPNFMRFPLYDPPLSSYGPILRQVDRMIPYNLDILEAKRKPYTSICISGTPRGPMFHPFWSINQMYVFLNTKLRFSFSRWVQCKIKSFQQVCADANHKQESINKVCLQKYICGKSRVLKISLTCDPIFRRITKLHKPPPTHTHTKQRLSILQ